MFQEVLICCPSGQEKKDCPFAGVRSINFFERNKYMEKLSLTERVSMHKEHIKCLRSREKELYLMQEIAFSI